jgi:uncharacterized transporter YbjL
MHGLSSQSVLAGAALLILGVLGGAMMLTPIPQANATAMTFILGALAGAITAGPGAKAADKLISTSGPNPEIKQ